MRRAALAAVAALSLCLGVAVAARGGGGTRERPSAAPPQEVQRAQNPVPNPWAVGDAVAYAELVAWARAVAAEEARLWARWGPLHDCEQPGDWYAAGGTSDGYFEGGLGIHHELYKSIAGHSALLDSPLEQMRVADLALARVGRGAWACPIGP